MKKALLLFANLVSTKQSEHHKRNATDAHEQLLPPLEAVHLLNLGDLFNLGGGHWVRHTVENVQRVYPCHYRLPLSMMPPFDYGCVTLNIVVDTITLDESIPNVVNLDTLNGMFLSDHHWHFNSFNLQLLLWLASAQ